MSKNMIMNALDISSSERYAVLYADTFLTVIDNEEKTQFKIDIKYVAHACITEDDRLLIGSTTGSHLFVYDLKQKEIILKKCLSRKHWITLIQQYDEEKVFIWCQGNKDTLLCIYDLKNQTFKKQVSDEIEHVFQQVIYAYGKPLFKLKMKDHYRYFYYAIDENNQFIKQQEINPNSTFTFSKNGFYCLEYKKNPTLKEHNYDIKAFDLKNNKLLWQVQNIDCKTGVGRGQERVFYSKFAISLLGAYIGDLILDQENQPVLYRYQKNILELYYITKGIKKEIVFEDTIGVCRVSIKHDYVLLRIDNFQKYPRRGKGQIYKLSELLE